MDILGLLLAFGILFGIMKLLRLGKQRPKCYEIGEIHAWVVKGIEPNTYLVCQKCGFLPSGETEERD